MLIYFRISFDNALLILPTLQIIVLFRLLVDLNLVGRVRDIQEEQVYAMRPDLQ